MKTYTVRNLDEKTKKLIAEYAHRKRVGIASAMRDLVSMGIQHLQHKKKKYDSFFQLYQRIKFRGGLKLSEEHDKMVYGL